jgi:hypothetical protein
MCSFSAVFVSLVVQNILGCLRYLCNQTMILSWPQLNLLEANWISIQEIFELVSRVLTWIFVGLWPKQRAEVPDLKKLANAFDTPDDPILLMKGRSVK